MKNDKGGTGASEEKEPVGKRFRGCEQKARNPRSSRRCSRRKKEGRTVRALEESKREEREIDFAAARWCFLISEPERV